MPRKARLDTPGTLHYVMIRGLGGRNIFKADGEWEKILSLVRELSLNTQTRVLAWALMGNHVHLLLFSAHGGLPAFMRKLLTGYAVWFNRKHRRRGHLFQDCYRSIVCEEDLYLLALVRYIHLNPLRSRAVKNVPELHSYRWSGHSVLVGKNHNDWQETEYVWKLFGGEKKKAMQAYRKFVEEGKDIGPRPEVGGGGLILSLGGWAKVLSLRHRGEKEAYDARILGSGDFVQKILQEADDKLARQIFYTRRAKPISEVIEEKCMAKGVRVEELLGEVSGGLWQWLEPK